MSQRTGVPAATSELRSAITTAVDRSTGPEVTPARAEVIAAAATAEIRSDPVTTNALNQEPWWQSGVGVFGTGGLLWSLGFLLREVAENRTDLGGYDVDETVGALGTVLMFGMVLYRRFVPGLKPMFWRLVRR